MDLIGSIIALVVGILLIVWTVHIALVILGWILAIVGAVFLLKNLLGRKSNRTDL